MEPSTTKNIKVRRPSGALMLSPQKLRIVRLEDPLMREVPFAPRNYFFHFIFVTKGSGWNEIDFMRYEFKPGRVFIVKPGQLRDISLDPGSTGYLLEFDRDFIRRENIMEEHFLKSMDFIEDMIDLPEEKRARIFFYLKEICREKSDDHPKSEVMIHYILKILIILLTREGKLRDQLGLGQLGFLDKFHTLIEDNYSTQHSVEFYSKQLEMPAKALTVKIKNNTGRSARYFIQQRCILESKCLLAYTDLSVKEITHQLGFEDPSYFSRFFTRLEGMSPQTFRKKQRQTC